MPTDSPSLEQLVADAKRMPASMLPRPRSQSPDPKTIDLTKFEIRIPDSMVSLVDDFEPYGS